MFTRDAVLFANEAFYQAFASADAVAMETMWSRESAVTCIHPGWHALHSRELIMEVWQRIFAEDRPSVVVCHAPEVFVSGEVAFVVCYEQLAEAVMIATNIFRREQQQWRLVHHQSSPTPGHPANLAAMETSSQLAH